MSSSNAISVESSFDLQEVGIDSSKHKRYKLCLNFIKQIIKDFNALEEDNDPVFDQLGHIACCIDTYVDELNYQIKYDLQNSFSPFFDSLKAVESFQEFQMRCLDYRAKTLFLADQPCSYSALYDFFELCRELELLDHLKSFSLKIIHSSIQKQEAKDVNTLISSVEEEGRSAVNFLMLLLKRKGVITRESSTDLRNYFIRIERVLNIADEVLDSRSDKQKGIIRLRLNLRYYGTMLIQLTRGIGNAFLNHPLMFGKHCTIFTFKAIKLEWNK